MKCDENSLLPKTDEGGKRNLILVGGHEDNVVDLCGEDNADTKNHFLDTEGTDYDIETTESI
jgi:hypothetical protein